MVRAVVSTVVRAVVSTVVRGVVDVVTPWLEHRGEGRGVPWGFVPWTPAGIHVAGPGGLGDIQKLLE